MEDRRAEHRRRLAELAAEDRRSRAAAEPEIARKEAALAQARSDLQRVTEENAVLQDEIESLRPAPANDDAPAPETR